MTVSALSNTETPTNSVAHVRDLADQGLGWEDIVVILRADGLRIGVNARERIKRIVLTSNARRPRMLAGAGRSGPGPICRLGRCDDPTQDF